MSVSHAYVYYTNVLHAIVPLSFVENFAPKSEENFEKKRKYKVWLRDEGQDTGGLLLNAYILILGSSQADVTKKRNATRLKLPNKRLMSFSSGLQESNQAKPSVKARKKLNFQQKEAEFRQSEEIVDKYKEMMSSRKKIDDALPNEIDDVLPSEEGDTFRLDSDDDTLLNSTETANDCESNDESTVLREDSRVSTLEPVLRQQSSTSTSVVRSSTLTHRQEHAKRVIERTPQPRRDSRIQIRHGNTLLPQM